MTQQEYIEKLIEGEYKITQPLWGLIKQVYAIGYTRGEEAILSRVHTLDVSEEHRELYRMERMEAEKLPECVFVYDDISEEAEEDFVMSLD